MHADLASKKHLQDHKDSHASEDLPGLGRWYCIECAMWFESETNFVKHAKGKPHKRRVRQLKEEPYTQKDAEAAAGLTTDNGKKTVEREMVDVEEDVVDVR